MIDTVKERLNMHTITTHEEERKNHECESNPLANPSLVRPLPPQMPDHDSTCMHSTWKGYGWGESYVYVPGKVGRSVRARAAPDR